MQQISIPSVDVYPTAIEKRSFAKGLLVSGFLHVAFAIIASLIVFTQLNSEPLEPISAAFDADGNSEGPITLLDELDAAEISGATAVPNMDLASADLGTQLPSSLQSAAVDWNRFGSDQGGSSSGLGELAFGIQERVGKAGGKSGEVQFSLSWHSTNDLDLHVITPAGEHISYQHRQSQCNGVLDVDMNVQPESTEPVENVRWLDRSAPNGRYTIMIHLFRWRSNQTDDRFELLVKLGDETSIVKQQVSAQSPLVIQRFKFVKPSTSASRRKVLLAQYDSLQEREELRASGLLEKAIAMTASPNRDEALRKIINEYAHTDASIRAMQELTGDSTKQQ